MPIGRRTLLLRALVFAAGGAALSLAACAPSVEAPTAAPPKPAATSPAAASPAAAAPTSPAKPAATAPPAKPAATQAPPKPVEVKKVRAGMIAGVLENSYVFFGKDKGFFREYGLDPEFTDFQSGVPMINGLISGELDAGHTTGYFTAVEKGAGLKMIGFSKPKLSYALYARKEYNKLEDLVGKSIGTGGLGSILHLIMLGLLEARGVDPNSVEFVNIGSSPSVFKAVVAGKIDAGPSTADFIPTAEADPNIKVLLHFAEALPKYGQVALITTGKNIAERPEVVQGLVNAWSKSYRYAIEHKDEIVEYATKLFSKPREEVAYGHEYGIKYRIINPDMTINPEGIEYMQQINVKTQQQQKVLPFDQVVDTRFQKKIIETLGPFKWPS